MKTIGVREPGMGFLRTLILGLPMLFLTGLMLSGGRLPALPAERVALALSLLFFNLLFHLMLRTGRTDRYRAILFITYSVAFVISFITHLIEVRGSMALSGGNLIEGETPFCHIVIPMTLIPAALTKTIIYPGTLTGVRASIAGMFVLWIGASLALGRGFCGWVCFFGGLEDGFSRLLRNPVIKRISPHWTYLPYAVLLVVVLTAAVTLSPTYCEWLCPFKTVTEYVQVTSVKVAIQTAIFLSLFLGLVIVLPILTKRRTQCGFLCPFGAFQSATNKLNVFEVRINKKECVDCGLCARACPTFSMDEASIHAGGSRVSCMKCGKCIDTCPKRAISFQVKWSTGCGGMLPRLLFLYPAFLFLAVMAGRNVQEAILRVIRLALTGSMT